MSRKDFVLIAKCVYNTNINNKEIVAKELANVLQQTNNNFKFDLFVSACLTGVMK